MKKIRMQATVLVTVLSLIFCNLQISQAKVISEAEKLNQLGLLLNISQDELKASLTREIGLTMILKALGYTQEEANTYEMDSPFKDTQRWSKGWISLGYTLGITTGTSKDTFTPLKTMSEKEFLTFLLRALGHDSTKAYQSTQYLSEQYGLIMDKHTINPNTYTKNTAAIAMFNALSSDYLEEDIPLANLLIDKGLFTYEEAINVGLKENMLEVLRLKVLSPKDLEVDFSQSANSRVYTFEVKSSETSFAVLASWSSDEKEARIQTLSSLETGSYELHIVELTGEKHRFVKRFTVKDVNWTPEIESDTVQLKNATIIGYSLLNNYKKDSFDIGQSLKITVTNLTLGVKHSYLFRNQNINHWIELPDFLDEGAKIGDVIEVELSIEDKSVSKKLIVVDNSNIIGINFDTPISNDGFSRLKPSDKNVILPYKAYDNQGALHKLKSHSSNQDGVFGSERIDDFIFTSSNPGIINVDDIRVNSLGELLINFNNSPGAAKIKATHSISKEEYVIDVFVYPNPTLVRIEVDGQLEVTSINQTTEIDVKGYDQFGGNYKLDYVSGIQYTSSDEEIIDSSEMKVSNNLFSFKGIKEGSSVLRVLDKDNHILLSIEIFVEDEAKLASIKSFNIPKYIEASDNAYVNLSYNHLSVYDQFGRPYNLSENNELFIIEADNSSQVLNIGSGQLDQSGLKISGIDDEQGTSSYTIHWDSDDSVSYPFKVTSVKSEDIKKYVIKFDQSLQLDKVIEIESTLKGYTEANEEVILADDIITLVTSSNPNIINATFNNNEITLSAIDEGTVTITVWSDIDKIATSEVTVLPSAKE